jgi:diguanylate cyclase (GGDEF)-like protein
MAPVSRRFTHARPFLTGLMLCVAIGWNQAAATPANDVVDERLSRIEAMRTKDHARFVEALDQFHREAGELDARQRWRLRYLDGWELNFEGRYPDAETVLRDVVEHANDDSIATRATGLLMNNLSLQGKYAEAYAIATRAAETLPGVTDPVARFVLLANLSEMLTFAGQTSLALNYAKMMEAATPPGEAPCQAFAQKVVALEGGRRLSSSSTELLNAINICTTAGQPVYTNAMSMILVDRLLAEGHPDQAMVALDRIAPSVQASAYFPHLIGIDNQRAQAYAQLGNEAEARAAALRAVSLSHPGDVNEWLRGAYRTLYKIDKGAGHYENALKYYEQYVKQDQGYLQDATARNVAYEAAKQHFLTEKLETDGLSKENSILRLRQALDNKAVETSRLYIVVLIAALASIALWLVRLKRSQLRFKRLSACDSLTGIFNHQHFMTEAERALHVLAKRQGHACLLSFDLDHFKQVNDTYGHAVGDAVLKHVVEICKSHLRRADIFGRLGGEEFGIFLMDAPCLQGTVIAEQLRLAFETMPLVLDETTVPFSASVGLACTETIGYDLARLCRVSDAALYQAKRSGRNILVTDDAIGSTSSLPLPMAGSVHRTSV